MHSRNIVFLLGAVFILNACTTSKHAAAPTAEITKTVIRSFDQAVVAAIPAHWPQQPATIQRGGNSVRATFLPDSNQISKNERITVTIREADIDANDFALYASEQETEAPCTAGASSVETLSEDKSGTILLHYCGRLQQEGAPQGQVRLVKTVEKNGEIYDISHQWIGDAFNVVATQIRSLPVGEDVLSQRRALLNSHSAVCTRRAPESYCNAHASLFVKPTTLASNDASGRK